MADFIILIWKRNISVIKFDKAGETPAFSLPGMLKTQ